MIVSDSSTLIVLFDLGYESFLSNLFSEVIVPKAVYNEVWLEKEAKLPSFIKINEPKDKELILELEQLLDRGESEAIALAIELDMPLIIDEKKGRVIAKNRGLKIVGLLGIVMLNIKKGYICEKEAKEFLDTAIKNGFRIKKSLIDEMFESLKL